MKYLGVDYGDVRTGLAVSDALGFLATPIETVTEPDAEKLKDLILAAAKKQGAGVIVLGFPRNMNGTVGERGESTLALKQALEAEFEGEVVLRDERCTTISAHRVLNETNTRGKKRKAVIDTLSATIILQDYLDGLK